jgi:hypothetical protein
MKIITDYVYPPIPIRDFDWCAFYEGEEESQNYGWGKTEEEAIKELKENYNF